MPPRWTLAVFFGLERIAHVELQKLAGSPGRDVQPLVVEGQVDVGHQRWHGFEALEQRRKVVGVGGLRGNLDHFVGLVRVAVEVPGPDRRAEVLEAGHHADEPVRLGGVVRRAQLEHHLVLGAEVDLLAVAALGKVPDVELVTVTAGQQGLRDDSVLDHVRSAPLAGDRRVVTEVPPEVVSKLLRAAVQLPAALHREGVVVDDENTARPVSVGRAQRADVDSVGTAVDGVRAAVAGAIGDLIRLDGVHELRLFRVRLHVEDVDARRAEARNQ